MRCCYHVQTHRSPHQVERLVATIRRSSPDSVIHISHDRNGPPLDITNLSRMGDTFVELHDGGYGDFSHVDRYLAGVDFVERHGLDVDWFVNLTGQDYPLVPLDRAEEELRSSGVDGFVEHWDAYSAAAHWPAGRVRSRYEFRHHRVVPLSPRSQRLLHPLQAVNRVQPLVRVHVSYGLAIGRRTRPLLDGGTEPGLALALHGGSAYASLRWPVARLVRDVLTARPDLVDYFRHTLSPAEVVLQTIICHSPAFRSGELRLDPDCKRWFDFRGSRFNHPKDLTLDDLPVALASGAHFARKFDAERRPELLDLLDVHLAELARRRVAQRRS